MDQDGLGLGISQTSVETILICLFNFIIIMFLVDTLLSMNYMREVNEEVEFLSFLLF